MAFSSNWAPTNVRAFGAKGDEQTNDTPAIQAALDAVAQLGSGTLVIPPGKYRCGTLFLRDNLTIDLLPGSVLLLSPDEDDFAEGEDFPYNPHADMETSVFRFSCLFGEDVQGVTITGGGTIDGNRYQRGGPKPIALKSCDHITIRDITITRAPNYAVSLMDCDYVTVDNVTIHQAYADGIDLDNCRFCRVSNCHVDSADDGICLKTSPALGHISQMEHITITNCSVGSSCNCLKFGTETSGDCRHVAISNCVLFPQPFSRSPTSGISIETTDGARVTGFVVTNITMQGCDTPIFLRLNNRGRAQEVPTPGTLEDLIISNINATNASFPSVIAGLLGHPIRRVTLENIHIEYPHIKWADDEKQSIDSPKSTREELNLDVPEAEAKYPDPRMFGDLPAWGMYCRHVTELTIKSFHARLSVPDDRSCLVGDDLQDLLLDGLRVKTNTKNPTLWLNEIKRAAIRSCDFPPEALHPVRLSGSTSSLVTFFACVKPRSLADVDLRAAIRPDEVEFR